MAFIITVAQRKGGAGKTTLCCQLTAAFIARGVNVAAMDLDDQHSFSHWAAVREERLGALDFGLDSAKGFAISSSVRRARHADVVIIDTPPTIDSTVTRAVGVADLVLAPLQLTSLDLDASLPTARMIGQARKEALFVINRAPPRARIADQIREKIIEHGLPVAKTALGNRSAYAETLATGRSVAETARTSPAALEIEALTVELLKKAGLPTRCPAPARKPVRGVNAA